MPNRLFSHTPEKARQPAVGWLACTWLILVLLMQCLFSSVAAAKNLTAKAQSTPASRAGDSVWLSNAYDPLDRRIWKEQYKSTDGQALAQLDIISSEKPKSWEFLKRLPKLEWAAFDGDMVWENGEFTKKSSKHEIQLESDPDSTPPGLTPLP